MLRYSHPARNGQAPSLRRRHIVTLQSSKAVFTDAERLKNTLQADSDREPKGSEFTLHLHMFCRRTSKLQLMACEI